MAYYAALLSTIELLEDILHPHRFPNSFSDDQTPSFQSLHQKFSQLLNSLQDYSSIGVEVDPMEARIRDASYQALDLIDSQIPEHNQHDVSVGRLFDWEKELEKVGQEVDSIVQELTAIKKQSRMCEHVAAASEQQPPPPPQQIEPGNTAVGFEDQALAIKELLCGESSQLQVIPIVGMGGIGKTTLARHTFDDPLIVCEFDFRGWVTISQDYHVIRVLQDIVKSLSIVVVDRESKSESERERELKYHIYKYLKGRKFLIVIDDVWNTYVWDDIKHIFPNDANGSRIVLTTRLADVGEYVAGSIESVYDVQFLDVDASWSLLQEKALVRECCPSELVNIGTYIASKCKGLPLTIVVIGGVLSKDKTLRHWKSVAENVSLILSKDDDHLSNILSLSYNHLPHHLKSCFLQIASFPEDYDINVSRLLRLWAAEGFLKTSNKSKSSEEIGGDYLKDLVKRSLVIITEKKKVNGEFKSCVMHDVLRDFCKQRVQDEHFFHLMDGRGHLVTNGMEKERRIVVDSTDPLLTLDGDEDGKYIRAICWFSKRRFITDLNALMRNRVDVMRILDVADLDLPDVPVPVSKMLHLKCLVLNLIFLHGKKHCIDPSILKFQNLETLIIRCGGARVITLPAEIWKMLWLKYIIIDGLMLPSIPPDFDPLQKLEFLCTLKTLCDFKFTNQFTQMIPNVRNLSLTYPLSLEMDLIWKQYGLNNLVNLMQLEKLSISSNSYGLLGDGDLLWWSGIVFPHNLKKLHLEGCSLPWKAMRVVGCLKYLEVLELRDNAFVGDVWEPVEGEFLELKFLLLFSLRLKQWRVESTHFPKLQHLQISYCYLLEDIPLDIGDIGTLQSIDVIGSRCLIESTERILEQQQDLGNYGFRANIDHLHHFLSKFNVFKI